MFWKLLFYSIDLNCIFYAERSSEASVCDRDRDLSKEGVVSYSIASETCCLSVKS